MDAYQQRLSAYKDVSGSGVVTAAQDLSGTARVLVALRLLETIFIQKITLTIKTDNAATQSFQDTASSPVVALPTKASPGLIVIQVDFGPDGFALTEGKAFVLANSGAGLAYSYSFTAYQKLTAVSVGNAVNSSGIIN
jgi:hypothetical protein